MWIKYSINLLIFSSNFMLSVYPVCANYSKRSFVIFHAKYSNFLVLVVNSYAIFCFALLDASPRQVFSKYLFRTIYRSNRCLHVIVCGLSSSFIPFVKKRKLFNVFLVLFLSLARYSNIYVLKLTQNNQQINQMKILTIRKIKKYTFVLRNKTCSFITKNYAVN